jgi:hypothetical protein
MGQDAGTGAPDGVLARIRVHQDTLVMTATQLRPTFEDLLLHGTLSSAVLDAKVRSASRALPPGFRSLQDAIAQAGGTWIVGDEPGSDSYVDDASCRMIRTGALSDAQIDAGLAAEGIVKVASHAFTQQDLQPLDLLVAKDGPVGQVGLLRSTDNTMISSGLIRLRLPGTEFFHLGILKYGSYRRDIETLTPQTSSYRHAGRDLPLSLPVPDPRAFPEASELLAALVELVAECEAAASARLQTILALFDERIGGAERVSDAPARPSFADLLASGRLDAGRHGAIFGDLGKKLRACGFETLAELESSGRITIKRAQNLQVDAIGFSEKHDEPRPGAYRLIEPNMIRKDMTIPRSRWLSCATKLQTLPNHAVLLSAEGSVGNVTMFRTEDGQRTISNIHAFIIEPTKAVERESTAAWLVGSLVWLRERGWLNAVAAGGQGGSLNKNYHSDVLLPRLDAEAIEALRVLIIGVDGDSTAAPLSVERVAADGVRTLLETVDQQSVLDLDLLRRHAEDRIRDLIASEWPDLAT